MNRILALDGLRGVAVLCVLIGHLGYWGWPDLPFFARWKAWSEVYGGSFVGVQLFFVLSGFLITSLLLAELERTERLSLRRFWWRRARRLYPALVMTCAGLLAMSAVVPKLTPSVAALETLRALTYTSNFYPYPESYWLYHTWSLSVEEQFYVVWPLLVLFAYRIGGRRAVGIVAVAIALATIASRHSLELSHRIQYDVLRWDAPLLGCAVAAFRFKPGKALLILSGAVLGYFLITGLVSGPVSYTLAAIASAVLVAGASAVRLLETAVLRYFGMVSYGLYLWSCLILKLGLPAPIGLALSLLAAHLSWRFVESPIIEGRGRQAIRLDGFGSKRLPRPSPPG